MPQKILWIKINSHGIEIPDTLKKKLKSHIGLQLAHKTKIHSESLH